MPLRTFHPTNHITIKTELCQIIGMVRLALNNTFFVIHFTFDIQAIRKKSIFIQIVLIIGCVIFNFGLFLSDLPVFRLHFMWILKQSATNGCQTQT